jgi:hypothetical protein
MTAEQRNFVADVIGALARGRAGKRPFNPVPDQMADSFQTLRRWFDILDEAAGRPRTPSKTIHEMLAKKYGFANPEQVHMTLVRRAKKNPGRKAGRKT